MITSKGTQFVRIDELADASGTTVRNIRVYQEKGLLPAPVRRGRTALYGPEHQRRLEVILRLLDRGYTFATIGELLGAEISGLTISDLLKVESTKGLRKLAVRKRPYTKADVQAITGFELSDRLIEISLETGFYLDDSADDAYHVDAYTFELLRELVGLGLGAREIENVAEVVFDSQRRSAEAVDIVLEAMARSGLDEVKVEVKALDLVPRLSTAIRLIFRNAAYKRIREQALIRQGHAAPDGYLESESR